MSLSRTAPIAADRPFTRDRVLDLVRFGCLLVVVVLHTMMSGVELGTDGAIVPTVALSGTTGFALASWAFQIMPLFFAIGGFAALQQWRRTIAGGGTGADYLRVRVRRLVAPVTVLVLGAGTGLALASESGVPRGLLAEASLRIGQPLWFLAVYVGLTALVPFMAQFHERAPRRTLVVLAGAVAMVDGLVRVTGLTGLGYLNLLVVWPLIQQLGFVYDDLRRRTVAPTGLAAVAAMALGALVLLVSAGVYSPNMLVNLNPPTGALVLLGLVQLCLLRLVHDSFAAALDRGPGWERVIAWGNANGMHVYLWHMSVIIALIGIQGAAAGALAGTGTGVGTWLSGVVVTTVESPWWWLTRLPWVVLVGGLAAVVAAGMAKVDVPAPARLDSLGRGLESVLGLRLSERVRAASAVGCAMAGIGIALLVGLAPFVWTLLAAGLLFAGLVLAAGLRRPAADVASEPDLAPGPDLVPAAENSPRPRTSVFDEPGERLGDGAPALEEAELLMRGTLLRIGMADDRAVVGAGLPVAEDDLRGHRNGGGQCGMPRAVDGVGEDEPCVLLDAEEDGVDVRDECLAVLAHAGDERAAGTQVEGVDAQDERLGNPPLDQLGRIRPRLPDRFAGRADDAFDEQVPVGVDVAAGFAGGVGDRKSVV